MRKKIARLGQRLQDAQRFARSGLRPALRSPGQSLVVILSLAAGLAPVLLIGSFVDAVTIRPLPYPEPDRLVAMFHERLVDQDRGSLSYPTFLDVVHELRVRPSDSLASLAAYVQLSLTVEGPLDEAESAEPVRRGAAMVSASFFDVFGLQPHLGRFFVPGEDLPRASRVVAISDRVWSERFDRARDVIGADLLLDAQPHRVVGIVPAGLEYPPGADLWVPMNERVHASGRFDRSFSVIGRLDRTATLEAAQLRLQPIAANLLERVPEAEYRFSLMPLREAMVAPFRPLLWALFGVVFLVLLAAWANAAGFAAAMTVERTSEMAVRASCGALPAQIRGHVRRDVSWLTLVGGALGILLAVAGGVVLRQAVPGPLPRYFEARIDLRSLLILGTLVVATHWAVTSLPARLSSQTGGRSLLVLASARHGAGRGRWRRMFLLVQGVLTFVLLAVAAALLADAVRLARVDPGFRADGVVTGRIALSPARYPTARTLHFYLQDLEDRLQDPATINAVAIASRQPIGDPPTRTFVRLLEAEQPTTNEASRDTSVGYTVVSARYFSTLGIAVLGNDFSRADEPVEGFLPVVVNNTWAESQLSPASNESGGEPADLLGRHVEIGLANRTGTIVGIAEDVLHDGTARPAESQVYLPLEDIPWREVAVLARGSGGASTIGASMRRAAREIDPMVPIFDVAELSRRLEDDLFLRRLVVAVLLPLSLLVMVMTSVGLAAMVVFAVQRERRAIGLRLALGATPAKVRAVVTGRVLRAVLLAQLAGVVVVLGLQPAWERLLAEPVAALELVALWLSVSMLTSLTAALTAWWASASATRIDPNSVLREG